MIAGSVQKLILRGNWNNYTDAIAYGRRLLVPQYLSVKGKRGKKKP
ncbi:MULTISPECIES: hypothetical protein [unclassified Nostoc]|nr:MULTISPECIES: hypothetical protein [unclassified Nostoc]MDZ8121966.1 hypothetical protein [Nostoc sp. CmiVER01]MDZ8221467.1 hypothetical protein [Nostoc sp. ChiVER01]